MHTNTAVHIHPQQQWSHFLFPLVGSGVAKCDGGRQRKRKRKWKR